MDLNWLSLLICGYSSIVNMVPHDPWLFESEDVEEPWILRADCKVMHRFFKCTGLGTIISVVQGSTVIDNITHAYYLIKQSHSRILS